MKEIQINIEVDVLAKYAEKMAHGKTSGKLKVAELIKQGFSNSQNKKTSTQGSTVLIF